MDRTMFEAQAVFWVQTLTRLLFGEVYPQCHMSPVICVLYGSVT